MHIFLFLLILLAPTPDPKNVIVHYQNWKYVFGEQCYVKKKIEEKTERKKH
jgi:hypothetical protein